MHDTSSTLHGLDRTALERVLEPIVRAHGAELADVEFRPERQGWVLRVVVEKEGAADARMSSRDGAVDLELCAGISRDLSPALDVADIIPHAYHLEVSSPGLERRLRSERDFTRFVGQRVKIKLRTPPSVGAERGAFPRVVVGTLSGVSNGNVQVVDGARVTDVPLTNIEGARLVFEFGPRPKPVSGRHTQHRKH
jgi:ribosome maturation factor RimP